jgi:hypothetical protein
MAKTLQNGIKIVFVMLLVFLVAAPYAQAQDKKAELTVYRKFYKVTNAEAQYNQIINIMAAQFQQGFISGFRDAAKKMENATPAEQENFGKLFQKSMASYQEKMRKKAAEVMPLTELIDNVYYPSLSKHFTISEVEEMIKFFESPVGQKYISVAPTVLQESSALINQKYMPQLQKIGVKVAEEELKRIKPELEKLQKKD